MKYYQGADDLSRGVRAMEQQVGYVLKQAQQALRAAMDDALRRHSLTTPQYSALTALAEGGELSGAELARRGFVTPQTMNGIIVNLEGMGLVERRADQGDARVLRVVLTPAGRARFDACRQAVGAVEERMLRGLRPDERPWLLDALRRCAASLAG
jgi:DNA-binding MarR family transcriptional regulator